MRLAETGRGTNAWSLGKVGGKFDETNASGGLAKEEAVAVLASLLLAPSPEYNEFSHPSSKKNSVA